MDPSQKKPSDNVVDIAKARQQQQVLGWKSKGRRPQRAGASSQQGADGKSSGKWSKNRVWGFIQFILFLFLLSYFMRLCQGSGF